MDFQAVKCTKCETVVLDGAFTGITRAICPGCKRRVWVVSDGEVVSVMMVDSKPRRLHESRVAS